MHGRLCCPTPNTQANAGQHSVHANVTAKPAFTGTFAAIPGRSSQFMFCSLSVLSNIILTFHFQKFRHHQTQSIIEPTPAIHLTKWHLVQADEFLA